MSINSDCRHSYCQIVDNVHDFRILLHAIMLVRQGQTITVWLSSSNPRNSTKRTRKSWTLLMRFSTKMHSYIWMIYIIKNRKFINVLAKYLLIIYIYCRYCQRFSISYGPMGALFVWTNIRPELTVFSRILSVPEFSY